METMNKCQECGKSISGGFLCEECEKNTLKKQKSGKYLLSGITGVILVSIVYILWNKYNEKQSQIDLSIFNRTYNVVLATGKAILASPFIFVPLVIVLLIAGFFIGMKLSK
jgi:hypothetical protein